MGGGYQGVGQPENGSMLLACVLFLVSCALFTVTMLVSITLLIDVKRTSQYSMSTLLLYLPVLLLMYPSASFAYLVCSGLTDSGRGVESGAGGD